MRDFSFVNFATIETDFRERGRLVGKGKVAIYSYGEFKKEGKIVNAVHSCVVSEIDEQDMISKILAYCNSKQQ